MVDPSPGAPRSPWTPWPGGDCPVDADTPVTVLLSRVQGGLPASATNRAGAFDWRHGTTGADAIVAYRVVPTGEGPAAPLPMDAALVPALAPSAPPPAPVPVPAPSAATRYALALAALLADGSADPYADQADLNGNALDAGSPWHDDALARLRWKNRVLDPAYAAALDAAGPWTPPTYTPPATPSES